MSRGWLIELMKFVDIFTTKLIVFKKINSDQLIISVVNYYYYKYSGVGCFLWSIINRQEEKKNKLLHALGLSSSVN